MDEDCQDKNSIRLQIVSEMLDKKKTLAELNALYSKTVLSLKARRKSVCDELKELESSFVSGVYQPRLEIK